MKQNIYDDPGFFERYSAMPRSVEGLRQAGEWHELRAMLPPLKDKSFLDLGCGFGWHCRFAATGDTTIAPAQILALLSRVEAAGFDFIKTENLYSIDGVPSYSS